MNDLHGRLSRRQFLKYLLSGALITVPVLAVIRMWLGNPLDILRQALDIKLDIRTPAGLLDSNELITVTHLAQVLIPEDSTPGASEEWVRQHVNHATESRPGYMEEYRSAAAFLNEVAAETQPSTPYFHLLSNEDVNNILTEMFRWRQQNYTTWRERIHQLSRSGRRQERLWHFVIQDILRNFYKSPDGWAVIGYDNYPGMPGDPRAYTSPPKSLNNQIRRTNT